MIYLIIYRGEKNKKKSVSTNFRLNLVLFILTFEKFYIILQCIDAFILFLD